MTNWIEDYIVWHIFTFLGGVHLVDTVEIY